MPTRIGFNGVLRFNHLHPPFNNVGDSPRGADGGEPDRLHGRDHGTTSRRRSDCKSILPCGTAYGNEIGAAAMPGDLDKARAALKAAGYDGEKVVIINPTDFATIAPMGDVTYDLLKKLGMNVELVATDWGTVTQRRASREPVEKGGWSILHTWAPSNVISGGGEHPFLRGLGATGWFGWYGDEPSSAWRQAWLRAETRGGTRRDHRCHPAARLRDGAGDSARPVPDPHRLSQEPDRIDRGHRRLSWNIRRV